MRRVSRPLRRWVGRTPTAVTPAMGTRPPGTVSANGTLAAVATIRPPSRTAQARSGSWTARMRVTQAPSESPWKAAASASAKASKSSGATGPGGVVGTPGKTASYAKGGAIESVRAPAAAKAADAGDAGAAGTAGSAAAISDAHQAPTATSTVPARPIQAPWRG